MCGLNLGKSARFGSKSIVEKTLQKYLKPRSPVHRHDLFNSVSCLFGNRKLRLTAVSHRAAALSAVEICVAAPGRQQSWKKGMLDLGCKPLVASFLITSVNSTVAAARARRSVAAAWFRLRCRGGRASARPAKRRG